MNTDKTRTTQDHNADFSVGQVSEDTFRAICTAMDVRERMDLVMDIFKDVVRCRPYGTEEDVDKWNRFLAETSADLAVIRMRAEASALRVKYDCGAMTKEGFMEALDSLRSNNCIVSAMLAVKEGVLGMTSIMEEPEEGSRQAPEEETEEGAEEAPASETSGDEYIIQED